jgi:hypothetical protein
MVKPARPPRAPGTGILVERLFGKNFVENARALVKMHNSHIETAIVFVQYSILQFKGICVNI